MANLGDLLIYAVFESYRRDFTDKIEVKNPNFVQALDKNVLVHFGPAVFTAEQSVFQPRYPH